MKSKPRKTSGINRLAKWGGTPWPVGPMKINRNPALGGLSRQTASQPILDRYEGRYDYADDNLSTSTSSTLATVYQYRASSMQDPDLSGTGHQPYQWDQIKAFYAYYKVHFARYKITFYGANQTGLWVGVNIYSSLSGSGTVNNLSLGATQERAHTEMKVLPNTGNQQVVFSGFIDLAAIHGLTHEQYEADNTNFGAAVSANPGQNVIIEAVFIDPFADLAPRCHHLVELEFYTQTYGYLPPGQS